MNAIPRLLLHPLILFVLLLSNVISNTTAANSAELQQDLQRMLAEERVAGAVFATVVGEQTQVGAVGYFDATNKTAMPADAKVHVGSVTKTILALSLLHLVSEGRLGLDGTVESILPAIRFNNPWQKSSPVRLRHLLDHTSGLEDLRLRHIFSAKSTPDTPLAEVFSRDPSVLRCRTEPGKRSSYSNLGYALAAMVIESVVKERYEAWADREILRKIGMLDSTFAFTTQSGQGADKRLAWGHLDDLRTVAAQSVAVRPAGQFTTTAADMAKLARFLMGNGQINGKPFIQKSLLQAMGKPATTLAAQAGLPVGYGLGMAGRDRYGVFGLCHAGSVIGYRAMFCLYPDQQRAFFIVHNTDSETARYARFEERMVQELDLAKQPNLAHTLRLSKEWRGRYVHAPSRFELAKLADVLGSSVYLEVSEAPPNLTPAWGETIRLTVVGERLLQREDRNIASHALLLDAQGQRYLADTNGTMRRVPALWYAAIWLSVGFGAIGLVYWLLVPALRRIRRVQSLWQPGFVAMLLLLLAMALFPLQSWGELGDFTLASGALLAASLALPSLMIWQVVLAYRQPARTFIWQCDIAAAILVLQFCALLFAWDLLPLALWR